MASIAAGFDKLVALTGNGSKFIRVNSGATAQEAVAASGTGNVVLTDGATLTGATITGSTLTGAALNGTIGATTPAAGAFTTLAASGAVSGAGFTSYLASPPSIGTGTPAAGVFTSLQANGALSGASLSIGGTATLQGLTDISGASAGQIKFPATQNASADANTLDDYEEGTWTPAFTCTTPGTLAITTSTAAGIYTKIGHRVTLDFQLILTAFTIGTASGSVRITGIPFVSAGGDFVGSMTFHGINKATFTQVNPATSSGQVFLVLTASGMNVAATLVSIGDIALVGGVIELRGTISYTA